MGLADVIRSRMDVHAEIQRQAYCLALAGQFDLDSSGAHALASFQSLWGDLKEDPYIPQPSFRLRRHGQFHYSRSREELVKLPDRAYVQTQTSNALYGGQPRTFAPLTPEALDNEFFHALVKFNLQQLAEVGASVAIHAHMVRVVARAGEPGEPSPEGLHQDGFDFISIHLMRRENVVGGETNICAHHNHRIASAVLANPLDSLYVNDRVLYHGTSAISPAGLGDALRDVLLLSYSPAEPASRDDEL